MNKKTGDERPSSIGPRALAIGFLVLLVLLTWNAGRSGLSSFLTTYAAMSRQVTSANTAVRLNAANADAHYVRATLLESTDLPSAVNEYYQAALARPDDYVLWLSLARARELNGEAAAAIAAAREALPLAPDYAEPHYQLGNILLRAGYPDEGFHELRLAGESNPTLLPGIIELAWRVSNGNAKYVEQAIAPNTPQLYLALGQSFRQKHEFDAAIAMYIAAGSGAVEARRAFLGELIAAKRFNEAASLWSADHPNPVKPGVMIDAGFERESNLREGFGWSLGEKVEGFRLGLDASNPREGNSSLKVEFEGNSDPFSTIVSQLVLVEPNAHYQLGFAERTDELLSGGLPLIVIIDANQNKIVSESEPFPKATGGWREQQIKIDTTQSTNAIQIALKRQPCATTPCPIFGHLWLDNFWLKKL